jgi:hypothetical protein
LSRPSSLAPAAVTTTFAEGTRILQQNRREAATHPDKAGRDPRAVDVTQVLGDFN